MSNLQNLFFPNINEYHKLCGLPSGTGLIRRYAEDANLRLPADAKTLRKALNFQSISKRKSDELEQFISEMCGGIQLDELVPKEDMLLVQAQWWGAIEGARIQSGTPDITYYVSKALLQAEARIALAMRDHRGSLGEVMILFLESAYCQYILGPDFSSDYTINKLKHADPGDRIEELVLSDEQFRKPLIFGSVSLVLALEAAREIEIQLLATGELSTHSWCEDLLFQSSECSNFQYPLKKLFLHWKNIFNLGSTDELASSTPTKFGSSQEDRARKVKYWAAGNHTPDLETMNSAEEWISNISGLSSDSGEVYKEATRFRSACFFQRLIKEVVPKIVTENVSLIPALQNYERHYHHILSGKLPTLINSA